MISSSYVQDKKHSSVSDKFQPIQASAVGEQLKERGFGLVSLISSKAKQEGRKDFQKTISRYRSSQPFEIDGLQLDIIYISKHMGRGQDEFRLGFYRGACANQWAVGKLILSIKIRHTGEVWNSVHDAITQILTQRSKLIESIRAMQAKLLTAKDIEALAKRYAEARLADVKGLVDVNWRSLAKVRREDDTSLDLFTVANVLQENVIRYPLQYRVNSVDSKGVPYVRNMTTQQLKESSSKLVDLNGSLFDMAMELAA